MNIKPAFLAPRLLLAAVVVATLVPAAALADGANRRVKIINETRHTMVRFYASNTNRTNWEEDILGEHTLPVGGSVSINIDDGSGACEFDFKGVFDDGDSVVKSGINVCRIESFRFTED